MGCVVVAVEVTLFFVGEEHQQRQKHQQRQRQLDVLDKNWGKKYPLVINSWRNNWPKLSTYFKYDPDIRRLIYTTNTIEGFHRQVRKVTKTKGAFPSDMALLKLIYLAYSNIRKKWTATSAELESYNIATSYLV